MINPMRDLKTLLLNQDDMLMLYGDFSLNFHLKPGKKEGEHYKIVDKEVWDKLHAVYGGTCIPRMSVAVPTQDVTRPDFIVET